MRILPLHRNACLLLLALLASGCSYRMPTEEFVATTPYHERGADHPIYCWIPRHRCQIYPWDLPHWITWAALGNDEDGLFGEGQASCFSPESCPSLSKAVKWGVRNPLHNFTFHLIGFADCPVTSFTLIGLSPCSFESLCRRKPASRVFYDSNRSSFYFVLHNGFPLLSLRLDIPPLPAFEAYIGWRERGAFGFTARLRCRE